MVFQTITVWVLNGSKVEKIAVSAVERKMLMLV